MGWAEESGSLVVSSGSYVVYQGWGVAGFEDLDVWKRAVELSAQVYLQLAQSRDFGFKDQITWSGLSIPSNIAEGMERSTPADQYKFLDYARASCGEFRTQSIVGQKAGFVTNDIAQGWINGLIRSIRDR
ncbi:hypothetical protein Poly24_00340 [Rosistilla carotiformis]|uniref:Four helix bundle protein n=1 Tax=Rosistilla carotiformis TaxID=2528017 RepID=A0A518JLD0_9BACT|nr:hypothetical protein Poly24_00340 [Rosistilla carotiformis]